MKTWIKTLTLGAILALGLAACEDDGTPDLIDDAGEARKVDIAARLGVAQPTVSKMISRLEDAGYINQRPYRGVFLTDAGRALAEECRERHRIVEEFLRALGVSEAIARRDAEGIEHHVSEETLEAFRRFTEARG